MRIRGTAGKDRLIGTADEDIIYGLGGNDIIRSNGGPDTIYGDDGGDTVYVRATGSLVYGEAGNDRIVGEMSSTTRYASTIDGGAGTDEFDLSAITVPASQGSGAVWEVNGGAISVEGFIVTNVEVLRGANTFNDFRFETYGSELTIYGSSGEGNGNLFNTSRFAKSVSYGGDSFDYFYMRASGSSAYGGAGDDYFSLLVNDSKEDVTLIDGGEGADEINITSIFATPIKIDLSVPLNVINGQTYELTSIENVFVTFAAVVRGTSDANSFVANYAYDQTVKFYGLGGDDFLSGARGADILDGGDGDDIMIVGGGDTVRGGEGIDTADFSINDGAVYVRLTDRGSATIVLSDGARVTATGVENVTGSSNGQNDIGGNRSNNVLQGGYNDDLLNGGSGDDTLIGGLGADILIGGKGSDTFSFTHFSDSNLGSIDTIKDFSRGGGDKIALFFDANTNVDGEQGFIYIGSKDFSEEAGQLRVERDGSGVTVLADTNGDGQSDFALHVEGSTGLRITDFIF